MKPATFYITLATTLLAAGRPGPAQDWSGWKYRAEVLTETRQTEYARLPLSPSIYHHSRPELADLRLTGPDGTPIPYILYREKDGLERRLYEPAVLDRSTLPTGAAVTTVDFSAPTVKNALSVETTGFIFRRAVKVEGSPDNRNYYVLTANAYVFADTYAGGVRKFSAVALPKNNFRYLKITVTPDPADGRPVVIEKITIEQVERTFAPRLSAALVLLDRRTDDAAQSDAYFYELPYMNLPLAELYLQIEEEAFYRYVTVEGRREATQKIEIIPEDTRPRYREIEAPWRHLVSQAVYRYSDQDGRTHQSTALPLPDAVAPRYLKLTIKNYDDRPLTLAAVEGRMIPHVLLFPQTPTGRQLLYLGNEAVSAPRYDLARRIAKPLDVEAAPARSDLVEANPLWSEPAGPDLPWTERNTMLIWFLLIAAVLVLAAFIYSSIRSLLRPQP